MRRAQRVTEEVKDLENNDQRENERVNLHCHLAAGDGITERRKRQRTAVNAKDGAAYLLRRSINQA